MNYLAHLALSHLCPEVMVGNFIGDCVKGRDYDSYSPLVRKGLLLHRSIDSFTDSHPTVIRSIKLLRPAYGHYAGIVCDMFYDHILAANWDATYPAMPLKDFVGKAHRVLLLNYFRMPGKMRKLLPFLIKSKRLETYATVAGLARSLNIMSRETSLPAKTNEAVECLNENYSRFTEDFFDFYPQVRAMCDEALAGIPDLLSK